MMNTESQQKVIDSNSNKIVVQAGAGSGKTATIINRINRLISDGVKHKDIICISFTNEAANVITERLGFDISFAGTLHGFCYNKLKSINSKYSVIDEKTSDRIIEDLKNRLNYKDSINKLKEFRNNSNSLFISKNDLLLNKFEKFWKVYENYLESNCLLDFDIILLKFFNLLKRGSFTFSEKYIFIDEYQDSSNIDDLIYNEFSKLMNVCIVGDVNQSIFGFRGGNPKFFKNKLNSNEWETHYMMDNFRSDKRICDAANKCFEHDENYVKMIPFSQNNGEVCFFESENEGDTQNKVLTSIKTLLENNKKDIAILARTNAELKTYKEFLANNGIEISKTEFNAPKDWELFKSIIFLKQDINNRILGENILINLGKQNDYINSLRIKADLNNKNILEIAGYSDIINNDFENINSINFSQATKNIYFKIKNLKNIIFEIREIEKSLVKVNDGIIFSTVHSAKGREWENVIIVGLEEKVFPLIKGADMEEENRLFYVAISRAKHSVMGFSSRSKFRFFKKEEFEKSRFYKNFYL